MIVTYTVVTAPAGDSVGCISHLLQGLGTQVAELPKAAIMEDPGADPAGVQVVGRPHLTHVTHLIAWGLKEGKNSLKSAIIPSVIKCVMYSLLAVFQPSPAKM